MGQRRPFGRRCSVSTSALTPDGETGLDYLCGAYIVGKWNLGVLPEYNPVHRGFDEFSGFTAAVHKYLPDPSNGPRWQGRPDHPSAGPGKFLRGTDVVDEPAYTTDAFAREALRSIDRHHGKPYFLYVPFNAAHVPLQATDKYLGRFPNRSDNDKVYAATVSAMDDAVGDELREVRTTGDEGNTRVLPVRQQRGARQHFHQRRRGRRGSTAGRSAT